MQVINASEDRRSSKLHMNIQYAEKSNLPLHLNIIEPSLRRGEDPNTKFPIIMYVQGSAWFDQFLGLEIPQLARFAEKGYVIAVVQYRASTTSPFPAQIKDTKTAIRFMQDNASKYNGDTDNIILWGDSSGGHTSVMTAFTLNDQELSDESVKEKPIEIKALIDFYGPTNIAKMNEEPSTQDHIAPDSPEGSLIGRKNVLENKDLADKTIPMKYLSKNITVAPTLIIHGNKDRLVPFGQSVMLFDALKENNKDAQFIQLKGADHGGMPFWQDNILEIVNTFIQKNISK